MPDASNVNVNDGLEEKQKSNTKSMEACNKIIRTLRVGKTLQNVLVGLCFKVRYIKRKIY